MMMMMMMNDADDDDGDDDDNDDVHDEGQVPSRARGLLNHAVGCP